MAYKGKFSKAKPAGSGWKKALIAVMCVVLILCAAAAAGYFYLDSKLDKITQAKFEDKGTTSELDAMAAGGKETEPSEEANTEKSSVPTEEVTEPTEQPTEPITEAPTEATEPDYGQSGKIVNILLVGQDFRENVEEHRLADSIMLFTLNKETCTLTATSFLRDSYVNLPDYYRGHTCGWNRINTAYALGYGWFGEEGAMDMLNVTIENNYGVKVDGNVEIGFETFVSIIDILGGIDIEFYGDEYNYMMERCGEFYSSVFIEGENHLDGKEALEYVSMRHSSPSDSDMNRAARQRKVVSTVLERFKTMSLLELNNLLDEVLPMIVTNISKEDMKMYIAELLPYVFKIELVSNQCPADGTYWGEMVELPDGIGGVLKIDFNQNRKLMQEICGVQ